MASVGSRRWGVVLLALVAGPLLAELCLRQVLFSDRDWLVGLARRFDLRRPELFCDPWHDDYWKLHRLFLPTEEERFRPPEPYDPLLGWRTSSIGEDYDHAMRAYVGERRPLVVYGSSFCGDSAFEEAFGRSELAQSYELINYAVGGYGADQVYLLLERSIDHFADLRPVVAIGLVVNGDFDRAALSFRYWPKPESSVAPDGRLVCRGAPLPSVREYLARRPPEITSYFLRAIAETSSSLTERLAERQPALEELFTAIVQAIDGELSRRGIPYFYVLFNDQTDTRANGPRGWQEEFLTRLFERQGIAYEMSGPVMRRAAELHGERLEDYFIQFPDARANHPTPRGHEVLLDCFRAGLTRP
jgi:hypothetical protein